MTLEELKKIFLQLKLPAFELLQVYQWLHQKAVSSFDEMKTFPRGCERFWQSSTPLPLRKLCASRFRSRTER